MTPRIENTEGEKQTSRKTRVGSLIEAVIGLTTIILVVLVNIRGPMFPGFFTFLTDGTASAFCLLGVGLIIRGLTQESAHHWIRILIAILGLVIIFQMITFPLLYPLVTPTLRLLILLIFASVTILYGFSGFIWSVVNGAFSTRHNTIQFLLALTQLIIGPLMVVSPQGQEWITGIVTSVYVFFFYTSAALILAGISLLLQKFTENR